MSIGLSLFLLAVGAILRYAVTLTVAGIELHTVGLILMIVGIIGLVISLLWMTVLADRDRTQERRVVRDRDV
jgi:Na+/melibiose symporter-like transporter